MSYHPQPLDTSNVILPAELLQLTELLARNVHDQWARRRMQDGWRYGAQRNEASKEHPCLVPYERLPESEKEYDRLTAMETIKSIQVLGYSIVKQAEDPQKRGML